MADLSLWEGQSKNYGIGMTDAVDVMIFTLGGALHSTWACVGCCIIRAPLSPRLSCGATPQC
jgi:hypothetical protein